MMSHVGCLTDNGSASLHLRRMLDCSPSCWPRHQLLRVYARRGSFGGRSWLTKVCWGRQEGGRKEGGERGKGR